MTENGTEPAGTLRPADGDLTARLRTRLRPLVRRIRSRGRRRRKLLQRDYDDWSIGILVGTPPSDWSPPAGLRNPVLTRESVRDVNAAFVADPFLHHASGTWHLFFEVQNRLRAMGEIAVATSPDTVRWRYRRVVLREPFHLSYPHVFDWEGETYMVPESHQARSVRLYRARSFPYRWEYVATLLDGAPYQDPSVFRHDGCWWLLTETNPVPRRWDTLRLYRADRLEGPWHEHPASPIVDGVPDIARPAGRVVHLDGGPVRFAQVCRPDYGTAVRGFRILELGPATYTECELPGAPLLGPGAEAWNATGIHHIDLHPLDDGRWLACVDGCGRRVAAYRTDASTDTSRRLHDGA